MANTKQVKLTKSQQKVVDRIVDYARTWTRATSTAIDARDGSGGCARVVITYFTDGVAEEVKTELLVTRRGRTVYQGTTR
jgi:hypothetical protein